MTEPTISTTTEVLCPTPEGGEVTRTVKGGHLTISDTGTLVVDGSEGEVAAFPAGYWTYAHATTPDPGPGDPSDPDDLVARLRRAIARLEERHEESRPGPEKHRLGGKIEGVQLALSYLAEIGRGDS